MTRICEWFFSECNQALNNGVCATAESTFSLFKTSILKYIYINHGVCPLFCLCISSLHLSAPTTSSCLIKQDSLSPFHRPPQTRSLFQSNTTDSYVSQTQTFLKFFHSLFHSSFISHQLCTSPLQLLLCIRFKHFIPITPSFYCSLSLVAHIFAPYITVDTTSLSYNSCTFV